MADPVNLGFIAAFLICFITYILHTESHYSEQKGQRPRFPESVVSMSVAIGYFAWFYMIFSDPIKINIYPYIQTPVGIAVGIIGVVMIYFAHKKKEGFSKIDRLETTGIYSKIRHPIYLGMILIYIGFPVAAGSLLTLASALIWIPIIFAWKFWEEKDLVKKFGKGYMDYKKRTLF